ncbi:rho family-interacting cell polarization regulator 2-like isoform X1 [Diadema antillarum]|uniref:rho family-interacting cell polarization regulator 2-like isoform X1 n=1 Tax=Diadema antillarum TaxID=105358 RepID=UPI003A852D64
MPDDTTVNKVDSEILPEDAVLNEALNLLDELANSEHKSNSETGAPPQPAASRSHSLELSQRDSETRPVETKSPEDREHGADWSDRGRLDSSLIGHGAGDSTTLTAKRGLVTTLTDSPVQSESAVTELVSIERNIGTRAHAASAGGDELEVLFLNEEVETGVQENIGKTEIPKISRSGTNGAFVSDCSARERSPTDISGRNKHTIEGRLDGLSDAVSPIPETETAVGADGEVIRRRRFVKQVSFQWEAGRLRQVIGDADKEDAEVESVPVTIETSPPDSPQKGILTRGRFSGKRDHPSLSKQTGEMYRRPKSEIFDNALRKEIPVKATSDVARQRPKSALYLSEADNVPVERGRAMPKHYRPQSDSLMQLDKFDSLQIKPKARRERSPSPGLRGFTSPVTQRKLRDRRRPQQRMLPPPSNTLRMPRQPRPGRMAVIIDALKNGLLDSIRVSNEKLEIMKQHQEETKAGEKSRQGFHYNLDKQLKAAERFIRKLQFHLAKVEELQELYEKELKVREGAMNMVKAYHDTHSPKAKEPVNEAKVGWRDCTQALCHMEAELEANLGAFVLRIEGIAGFARVTRGDVFEITFKYGFQKWKTKCKVEKDLSQTWEGDEIVLYPMVGDFLTIKVTEIRGIARSNVTIGNLEFDTSDFYGAEPQNLTIDVNETGTIKLNIIVTWSPFHVDEEDLKQINKNSYHRRERTFTDSAVSAHKRLSTASTSSSSDTPHSPVRPKPKPLEFPSSPTLTLEEALHNVVRLLEILAGQYNELKPLEQQITHLDSFLRKNLEKKRRESTISLSVKNALDSFNFLNEMDEGLSESLDSGSMEETNRKNVLDSLDVVPKSHSSDRLSDSTCIEDDFPAQLELRGIHRPSPSTTPTSNSTSTMSSPPSSTSSSVKRSSRFLDLSEKRESRMLELNEQRGNRLLDSPGDSSFGSMRRLPGSDREEPLNLTTGSDSIDLTLTHHLMFIEYLLSHLGAFGPLKLKETIALDKLQKQAVIIEQLIVLAVSGVHVASADEGRATLVILGRVLPELKLNLPLLEFWEQCKEKEALYVNADSFLLQLDVKFGAKLRTNHPEIADDVFQSLCHRIIERPADLLSPKTIITLFQYISFFTQESRRNPEKCINDLTNEFELTASLEPGNPELLRTIKRIPKGFLLPAGNLRAMGLLLLEDSSTVQMGVRLYLESIAREDDLRQRAVTVYQECLEERDLSLRQAGCAALAAMHATEALEQLVYLLRCDIDDVKTTAKESLMAFGDEGRLACEQVSYSPYFAYEQQYTQNGTPLMTTEL